MNSADLDELIRETEQRALPVRSPQDLAPLIERVRSARVVMLGEATHGTEEFYQWRRIITEWLVVKHGFRFVAVEGDWPSCRAIQGYIHEHETCARSAREALEAFHRWPTWMWANTEMVRMTEWMRSHNERVPKEAPERKVSFYGLDVYSFFESMDAVVTELEKVNLFYARQARNRYACFGPYGRDEHAYVRSLMHLPEGCEDQVVQVLRDLLHTKISEGGEGQVAQRALFDAQQNARVVQNAERYYRSMIQADEDSWNVRDRHMLETLDWLLERHGPDSRAVVWAHNTHVGDYRATDMKGQGLVNLGGLAREKYGEDAVALVGFGTYEGQVTASHAWGGPIETMSVPQARRESYDHAFHEACKGLGCDRFCLTFARHEPVDAFTRSLGQRAIGVVYNPGYERWSNYVPTEIARRYDALFFVDRTQALQPLILPVDRDEMPETWPSAQ